MARCTEELNPQAIGSALYGLQSLGDSYELRRLLTVLTLASFLSLGWAVSWFWAFHAFRIRFAEYNTVFSRGILKFD